MARRFKILFITPSLIGGGAERVLLNLFELIQNSAIDVKLISVLKKGVYVDQAPANTEYLYVNEFFEKICTKLLQRLNFKFPFRFLLRKHLKLEYDVVINFIDGPYASLLSEFQAPLKVSWVHSSYISNNNFFQFYQKEKFRRKVFRQRFPYIDKMVFVSESSQDEFKELFRDFDIPKSQIIYNPVNEKRVKKLAELSDGLEMSGDGLNLICVGSLLPVKNYSMLFKALKILSMEGKDYHLYLCGVGPLEDDLKEEIKTLGLFGSITLLGFQENPYKFISKCDLFIMPSISEALPTALIEAMILGKPALVTDVSGCREVVRFGKNGLLVDCSVDGLAKGLRKVIDRPQLLKDFQLKSLERSKDFSDDRFLIFFYELIGFKSDH